MHPQTFLKAFWRLELKPQIFVAMSFDDHYKSRFDDIIKPVIESIRVGGVEMKAHRVDLSKTGDSILTDIMDGIAHSRFILADVSSIGYDSKTGHSYRNGNVMYEVGLALACRQPEEVLLIRDDRDKFLFDISTIPQMHIDFGNNDGAKIALREELVGRLKAVDYFKDARVQMAIATLTAEDIGLLKEMVDLPVNHIKIIPHYIPGTFSLPGNPHDRAITRLVDKQIIGFVGEVKGGPSEGYAFRLTEFGHIIARIVRDHYPVIDNNRG